MDATSDVPPGKIRVEDAIRLLHKLNCSITYRGLNALDVCRLRSLSDGEWSEARKEYGEWIKTYYSKRILSIPLFIAALIAYIAGARTYWIVAAMVAFGARAVERISWYRAHREGYFEGYSEGARLGINKALGIDKAEARNMSERAAEIELNEGLIAKWDKGSTPP